MKEIIKLIRVKHWLKNFLIFVPLFFSINLFNKELLLNSIIGFFIFCITSSIVYILNDIKDLEKDKKNPLKMKRPLASGKVSLKTATVIIAVLSILDIICTSYLYINDNNYLIILIPLSYIIMNVLYSFGLKNIPILDVLIIALGFLLRIIYGGVVTDIFLSRWLYLIIIFGSFYLGYGKRKNELKFVGKSGRRVLNLYNVDFLEKNMYVCLSLSIIAYSLWTLDPITIQRVGNNYLFWTIPLVMIIFQQYSLNIEGESSGDPVEVLLSDKKLLLMIFFYIIVLFMVVYAL